MTWSKLREFVLPIGIIGCLLVFLVPVLGMTVIGIALIPIVAVLIPILWLLGYLAGAHAIAWRVASAFRELSQSLATKLVVTVGGVAILALLNFVPVIGWLINFLVVLLGLGAIAALLIARVPEGWTTRALSGPGETAG